MVRDTDERRHPIGELATRLVALTGFEPPPSGDEAAVDRWLIAAAQTLDVALHDSIDATGASSLRDLVDAWRDITHERNARRLASVTAVRVALARLRTTRTRTALFDRGVEMACEVCGFDRAIIYRVEGSRIFAERVHFPRQPELAREFEKAVNDDPPRLTHLLVETEMLRRRLPALVSDAAGDPSTYKPLISLGRVRSYVAAPILPAGKVIGFIHADRFDSGRDVDAVDRDVLHTFAEGFGYAFERTVLLERLEAQRREMQALVRSASTIVEDLATADVALADSIDRVTTPDAPPSPLAHEPLSRASRFAGALTRRELEVLELMAEGRTNAAIAEELVVSPATVKSHVQNVLRKLRASNRAEAVSRYLGARDG